MGYDHPITFLDAERTHSIISENAAVHLRHDNGNGSDALKWDGAILFLKIVMKPSHP